VRARVAQASAALLLAVALGGCFARVNRPVESAASVSERKAPDEPEAEPSPTAGFDVHGARRGS
jgi:hypothetical protein